MMKKYVFYPIIFSINPILLMYSINISDLPPSLLFPIILIIPILSIGLLWLVNKRLKNIHRSGFVIFIFILWFVYFVPFKIWISNIRIGASSLSSQWILLILWTSIFLILLSNWLWKRVSHPEMITMYLNLLCITLVLLSLFRISRDLIPRYTYKPDMSLLNIPSSNSERKTGYPDIYYIILDGYARQDVLRELYDYDNSAFIQSLRERGFYIASESQSNYIQTVISLASSLNMDYLTGKNGKALNHGHIIGMIHNSNSREFLENLGYKYITFPTGYPPTSLTNSDYYDPVLSPKYRNDLMALIEMNSAMAPFIDLNWVRPPISRYSDAQQRVDHIFLTLENDIPSIQGPKFVFAHVVTPHPPFIFDQYGPINQDDVYIPQRVDTTPGNIDGYKQGYISDLSYINKQTIQAIDGIIKNSPIPPIIILQADHGPDAYMDWDTGKNRCMKERFSILNAYYFPEQKIPEDVYQGISPVNTLRTIFNYYLGTELEILPDNHYFATWENSFPYTEISDSSQSCLDP